MDPTIPTPTACSTVMSSSVSSQIPPPTPSNILEISLISAQDLAPITKSMRTYATTWIHPNRKLTTRTDQNGLTNPTWNDKFAFRVDNELLMSENGTVTVEIYTVSWFRDVLVGIVQVLVNDLVTPALRMSQNHPKNTRFVALQVRRPSGSPQGILNMGIALLDSTMRSMPLNNYPSDKKLNPLSLQQHKNEYEEEQHRELTSRIQLWRSLSVGSEVNNEDFPLKPGSVNNGSMVNGSVCNGSAVNESEACSDIGPSASIVAAELAKKLQPPSNPKKVHRTARDIEETSSSILEDLTMEEAKTKGYRFTSRRERWRKEMNPGEKIDADHDDYDLSEISNNSNRHSRRNSDGGLFSCFGNAYGIEFTIVCGASNNASSKKLTDGKSRKKRSSEANSA
ncbi:uncharacterized protein LOC142523977 [Primulina tabacum]|uniref:uncharacterized protein LOC142523977 n=1 Tax=Primulina tabacum TaxID=48773 RepID=UPI003F5A66AF